MLFNILLCFVPFADVIFRLKCDEAPEEPSSVITEKVLKIECNISISTNYMLSGIMDVRAPTVLVKRRRRVLTDVIIIVTRLLMVNSKRTLLLLDDKLSTLPAHVFLGYLLTSLFTWSDSRGEQILARKLRLWYVPLCRPRVDYQHLFPPNWL